MILNNLKKFFFKRKKNNTRNINDILNNKIKLNIHKRIEIYNLLSKNGNIKIRCFL